MLVVRPGNLDIPRPLQFWQSLFRVWVSPEIAWFDSGFLYIRQREAFGRYLFFCVKVDLDSWDDSRPGSSSWCCLRSTRELAYYRFTCCAWFDRGYEHMRDSVSALPEEYSKFGLQWETTSGKCFLFGVTGSTVGTCPCQYPELNFPHQPALKVVLTTDRLKIHGSISRVAAPRVVRSTERRALHGAARAAEFQHCWWYGLLDGSIYVG